MTRNALILLLPFALACGGGDDSASSYSTAGDVSGIDSPSINRAGADCLAGTWEMDVETSYNMDGVNAMMDEEGGDMKLEFGGSEGRGFMTLGRDGSAEYTMDNLTITINADSPMGEMTMTNTMNGTSTGTYAVDGDTLRFTDGTGNMSTNTSVMFGGRQMSSSSSDLESVFETSDRSLMTYECTGDVLPINVH
ncbi:MAG: hypothetical protein IIC18_09755, partial [Bacteroidetes bacterium]|nr:hypothetical protein [Bacteroidota bacterium]